MTNSDRIAAMAPAVMAERLFDLELAGMIERLPGNRLARCLTSAWPAGTQCNHRNDGLRRGDGRHERGIAAHAAGQQVSGRGRGHPQAQHDNCQMSALQPEQAGQRIPIKGATSSRHQQQR